jgi:5-formyltetrahydrofolate cyclo-ligase
MPESRVGSKQLLRQEALKRRRQVPQRQFASRLIMDRLLELPEFRRAGSLLLYVDARTEVHTREAIGRLLADGRPVAVPYCQDAHLELFRLKDLSELSAGRFGILEPDLELRGRSERIVDPAELELVVVPGLAFDPRGARLGHGHGFYDRLLRDVRPETFLVAPAFQCQVFDELPTEAHDVFMYCIVTEERTYRCR